MTALPDTKPTRQQNSSCDQCRRSKRRCQIAEDNVRSKRKTCFNCRRLQQRCTFDFVTTTKASVVKRRREAQCEASEPGVGILENALSNDELVTAADMAEPSFLGNTSCFDPMSLPEVSWSNEDSVLDPMLGWSFVPKELDIGLSPISTISYFREEDSTVGELHELLDISHGISSPPAATLSSTSFEKQDCGTSWLTTPTQLLNSKCLSTLLDQNLIGVYKSTFGGSCVRYLDFNCNPLVGNQVYSLEEGDDCSHDGSHDGSHDDQRRDIAAFSDPGRQKLLRSVTFLGMAQFLDSCGKLYGHRLDTEARKQHEHALLSTLRAFALQWCSNNQGLSRVRKSTQALSQQPHSVFSSAWHEAHNALIDTKSTISFTRVLAVFMFDMTLVPMDPSDLSSGHQYSSDLLDDTLQQMLMMKNLVEGYTAHLPPQSRYRSLLSSSVAAFEWFGYVRDTIKSTIMRRELVLPETISFMSRVFATVPLPAIRLSDQNILGACQKAGICTLALDRGLAQIATVFESIAEANDMSPLICHFKKCVEIVAGHASTYRCFIDDCIQMFDGLADGLQSALAFHILFWNLGVSRLSALLNRIKSAQPHIVQDSQEHLVEEYKLTVVGQLTLICIKIENATRPAGLLQGVPNLLATHATIDHVILALVEALKTTLELQSEADLSDKGVARCSESTWQQSSKAIVTSLLSLEKVAAAAPTVRRHFHGLLHQYGDAVMDCWLQGT